MDGALQILNSTILVLVLFILNDLRSRLMRIEALHMNGGCKKTDPPKEEKK